MSGSKYGTVKGSMVPSRTKERSPRDPEGTVGALPDPGSRHLSLAAAIAPFVAITHVTTTP